MNLRLTLCLIAALLVLSATEGSAGVIVRWTGPGSNGHYYEAREFFEINSQGDKVGKTWNEAFAAAVADGGYLATIESAAENDFVFGLVDEDRFWTTPIVAQRGPWLGGYQEPGSTEPDGGWRWVEPTDSPFTYTNWGPNDPNNALGIEDALMFIGTPSGSARASTWGDLEAGLPAAYAPISYVIEWDSNPTASVVPEPSTLVLFAGLLGVIPIGCWRRKRSAVSGL